MRNAKKQILDSLDNFAPNSNQLQAIQNRDFLLASKLGVTVDQYLYYIDPSYRWKISSRLV